MTSACPSQDSLRGLVSGSLPVDEADAVQLHIEQCEPCQAALQELVADGTFWESAAASLSDQNASENAVGPALDRVVEELRQQSPEDAEEIGAAIELKLSFIEPPVEPGTIGRLQNYDILRVAGRGGMGIVVKAFDRSLRRVVAIKLLAPHLAGNGQARQRFVREGRAAAGICHEHVITIHAVEENPPFLVMNYVQGETLEARIHRNGALDVRETVRIAKQIAQGLAAAHAQGVVHRDIKPANILLENGVARVRITDFGLARAVDDASLTQSGVVAGTPQYMAPEQASGEAVDERADLFSLGSVIYTMLAGHAPFRATTAMGVLKRLCDHSARPIREINPDVPDWLVLLLNRLHAKRPADRFQSADEVAILLERGLAAIQTGAPTTVFVRPGDAETQSSVATVLRETSPASEPTAAFARQNQELAAQEPSLPRWLMLPIPIWLIGIPLLLVALGPLGRSAAEIATMILSGMCFIGLLVYGWKRVTAEPLNSSGSDNADTSIGARARRLPARLIEITPRGWRGTFGWLALWCLPIVLWTVMFYVQEKWALQMHVGSLPDRDRDIVATLAGVFCVWWLIAIAWFRRRRPDGSYFFERGRWKRVLATLVFAAAFCVFGYDVWHGNVLMLKVYWSHQQQEQDAARIATARQSTVGAARSLRIDFDRPIKGTSLVIELPDNEHYRFTSSHGGIVMNGFGSQSGTFPWRAMVGQSEFANGEVTLENGRIAEIKVPQPKLEQLISGRWESSPDSQGREAPGGAAAFSGGSPQEEMRYEFEFADESLIIATARSEQSRSVDRSDFRVHLDDSTTPPLINLIGNDGTRLVGILRLEPGHMSDDNSMGGEMGAGGRVASMSAGMSEMGIVPGQGMISGLGMFGQDMPGMGMPGMGMPGAGYSEAHTSDELLVCISDGRGLRPWEFRNDEKNGQLFVRLRRSRVATSLREELAYQPVSSSSPAERVTEAVDAWSQRLTIGDSRENSIGIDLVLVPPAEFSLPWEPQRSQRISLPGFVASKSVEPDEAASMVNVYANVPTKVDYPFVISRRPVTLEQFRLFVDATDYITDAERGVPAGLKSLPANASSASPNDAGDRASDTKQASDSRPSNESTIGGWESGESIYEWASDITWRAPALSTVESREVGPVCVVSWRDATAFCEWLSAKESRQYRLPTALEWVAAMQIGCPRWAPAGSNDSAAGIFDARPEHVLKLEVPKSVFAEWTGDIERGAISHQHGHRVLVRRERSSDGLSFQCNQQFDAAPQFRAADVGFRVVAELQTLSEK